MAFEIILCGKETCEGISLVDQTGFFGTEKPWGYNSPNSTVPSLSTLGVFGYTTYTLDIFQAVPGGVDLTTNPPPTPLLTVNLLTRPHTIDVTTGYVTWDFTLEDLGIEFVRSGWWVFRVRGVFTNSVPTTYTYGEETTMGFKDHITEKVDQLYKESDIDCECKKGCVPLEKVLLYTMALSTQGCCGDQAAFTQTIDWLYNNSDNCC